MILKNEILAGFLLTLCFSFFGCSSGESEEQIASSLAETGRQLIVEEKAKLALKVLGDAQRLSPKNTGIQSLIKQAQAKLDDQAKRKIAPLSNEFSVRGMKLSFLSAEKTKNIPQLRSKIFPENVPLLIVTMKVLELDGKYKETHWRKFVRVLTNSGDAIGSSLALVNVSSNGTPDFIMVYERKEMDLVFRLRENDFPLKLEFEDGTMEALSFSQSANGPE